MFLSEKKHIPRKALFSYFEVIGNLVKKLNVCLFKLTHQLILKGSGSFSGKWSMIALVEASVFAGIILIKLKFMYSDLTLK